MLQPGSYDEAKDLIFPAAFYKPANQIVWEAIETLRNLGRPADLLTVSQHLTDFGLIEDIGGPHYIATLTNAVVSGANIIEHSRIVLEKFMLREQIRISGETISEAYDAGADPFDIQDGISTKLDALNDRRKVNNGAHILDSLVRAVQRIQMMRESGSRLTGVTSGFYNIDTLTAGWQATDLIILAARPSVGKTALALNFARNAARHGTPVDIYSLEMSEWQLTNRFLSAESGIDLDLIQRGNLTEAQMVSMYNNGIQPLSRYPIYIDDTAALNIYEMRARARRNKKRWNTGLIIVDYLQLMGGVDETRRNQNREQEVSNISRNLKALAKELQVPVIALSQLSRGEDELRLSRLRDSGAIEQDADVVMFLTREAYEKTPGKTDGSLADDGRLRFAKHRNGELETLSLKTVLKIQRWMEEDDYNRYKENFDSQYGTLRPIVPIEPARLLTSSQPPVTTTADNGDDLPF